MRLVLQYVLGKVEIAKRNLGPRGSQQKARTRIARIKVGSLGEHLRIQQFDGIRCQAVRDNGFVERDVDERQHAVDRS